MTKRNRNLSSAARQSSRKETADAALKASTAVLRNDLSFPERLPKFLGLETLDGDPIWAFFADTLENIGKQFTDSATECVNGHTAVDLDTGEAHTPVFRVVEWG